MNSLATAQKLDGGMFPAWPIWGEQEKDLIETVLKSGTWAGSRCTFLPAFSEAFARFQNSQHSIPMANGSVTLEAALVACGIGENDEVIVPALTFVATAAAVLRVNATPVIVDVEADTFNIDPALVELAITPQTKAVIAVHLGGSMSDMDRLNKICEKRGLFLIEDCAHAHGSQWRARGAGSHGVFGSFSFQHSKLMTAGEGGSLTTNDSLLADRAWSFANCGRKRGGGTYDHGSIASNLRMTEWQAAILTAQLQRYPTQFDYRARSAGLLDDLFSGVPGIAPQKPYEQMTARAYYCYVFFVDPRIFGAGASTRVFNALSESGVPLSLSYPAMNELEIFRAKSFQPTFRRDIDPVRFALPVAEHLSKNTVWLHHRALLGSESAIRLLAEITLSAAKGG